VSLKSLSVQAYFISVTVGVLKYVHVCVLRRAGDVCGRFISLPLVAALSWNTLISRRINALYVEV